MSVERTGSARGRKLASPCTQMALSMQAWARAPAGRDMTRPLRRSSRRVSSGRSKGFMSRARHRPAFTLGITAGQPVRVRGRQRVRAGAAAARRRLLEMSGRTARGRPRGPRPHTGRCPCPRVRRTLGWRCHEILRDGPLVVSETFNRPLLTQARVTRRRRARPENGRSANGRYVIVTTQAAPSSHAGRGTAARGICHGLGYALFEEAIYRQMEIRQLELPRLTSSRRTRG